MSFLKSLYTVLELDSSEEEAAPSAPKRARTCDADAPSSASTAGTTPVAPLFLNKLQESSEDHSDELTLQDIFERHPLGNTSAVHVVLVNFMIDLPWMCRECPSLVSVPRLTVLYGDGGDASKEIEKKRRDLGLVTKLHSPPLPLQWGTHHSKIALLIYENCLRVCIRTFNDVFPDVHQKSNAMYLQDFPGKSPESFGNVSKESENDFGNDFKLQLFKYFGKCGGFDAAELDHYDFSTAAVAIVSSVPGYHSGQQLSDWGQLRLKQLLARHVKIQAEDGEHGEQGIICQASSFGNLPKKWLDDFHSTLATTSATRKAKPPMYLVAPTISQIRDSVEGWVSSVALFISKATVTSCQSLWRRWGPSAASRDRRSKLRAEAMPHVKTFCRFGQLKGPCGKTPGESGETMGVFWLYIGSHNLSKSAWGEVQKGGTQLCVRSYEMGVVFLPSRLALLESNPEKKGFFLRKRSSPMPNATKAVLVNEGTDSGDLAVRIAFPTAIPPGDPPNVGDPIWSRDWPKEVYEGLDRFGTTFGERGAEFYGYRALVRR